MLPKTCRPIDAYGTGARWSGSEPFPLACARDSLEHTPHLIDAVLVADQVCSAKLVGEQLAGCHRHRTPANGFPVDPITHLTSPIFPAGEPRDLRETTY